MKSNKESEQTETPLFTKQQFLESKNYTAQQKDVFNALLKDDTGYTLDEVVNKVEEFHRKVVG